MIKRLREDQKGFAAVLFVAFAGAMMALAALGADMGLLVTERHRMGAAADMAALSGGQFLPDDPPGAIATARRLLTANGYDGNAAEVRVAEDNRRLNVSLNTVRATAFARTFGINQATVAAGVEAWTENLTGVTGAVPLAVAQGDFVRGQQVTLRGAPNGGAVGPGNFQALALDPNQPGSNSYANHLRNGYPEWVRVDQWIDTEPGVAAGPTHEAIRYRIDQDPNATWQDVRRGSPRLLLVPVLRDWDVNGRDQVLVVGFAVFFLDSVSPGGGAIEITGRFIQYVIEGESSLDAPDFGARTVKLRE